MAQPNSDNENGNSEDTVSLKTLCNEDLAYIANNPGYHTMLQDILSLIIGEPSRKDGSADNTASSNSKGRCTNNTLSAQRKRVPDQHSLSDEPSDSESEDEDSAAAIIEKLSHALRKRKKSSKSASKRQKLTGKETEPQLFDPSLDKEDKDEYKFDVPEVIGQYLEQHFRKGLAKEELTAMLKRHPKPNAKVMTPRQNWTCLCQTLHRRKWTKQEMRL